MKRYTFTWIRPYSFDAERAIVEVPDGEYVKYADIVQLLDAARRVTEENLTIGTKQCHPCNDAGVSCLCGMEQLAKLLREQ